MGAPREHFHSSLYLRHNARRQEHLASLGLPLSGKTVLETGAGIGDHSHYFLDRGCSLTITEAREENLSILCQRYPDIAIAKLDLEAPVSCPDLPPHEVVYCYGTLYHLSDPLAALEYLADRCTELFLLETCVSFSNTGPNMTKENPAIPTQALSGSGCRPGREWLYEQLKTFFENVYVPVTQPAHEEFPNDWKRPEVHQHTLSRAIFICSRKELSLPSLQSGLPDIQPAQP